MMNWHSLPSLVSCWRPSICVTKAFKKLVSNSRLKSQYITAVYAPEIKSFFLQDTCELTLDTRTSFSLKSTEGWPGWKSFSHIFITKITANRCFVNRGLKGRCYWDIEVLGHLSIGVTYRNTGRKDDCKLGHKKSLGVWLPLLMVFMLCTATRVSMCLPSAHLESVGSVFG